MQEGKRSLSRPALDALQRWLQAVITHPAGIEAGIDSQEARQEIDITPAGIEAVVLPSSRQSSTERLAVYGNAYFLRLLECLRELFPCLANALGRETFDQFAIAYLQRHPPTSYTLQRLADRWVDYLAETQPAEDADWAGFVVELAQLESAIERVFDGPGSEQDPWGDISQDRNGKLIPADEWALDSLSIASRLVSAPGLTLLEFRWPVSTYYTQWKRGENPIWPRQSRQYVALLRRDYIVRRHELPAAGFTLLSRLVSGWPIGEAVAAAASGEDVAFLDPTEVHAWMMQWARERFFVAAMRD